MHNPRFLGVATLCLASVGVAQLPCALDAPLTSSDGVELDGFGTSVALLADVAIIGAPGDDDQGPESGSVYVFRRDPATGGWTETQKLPPLPATSGDLFGSALAVSGDTLVVGAPRSSGLHAPGPGSAYVFRRDAASGTWLPDGRLVSGSSLARDFFGHAVAVDGDRILVSALAELSPIGGNGVVFVFERDPLTGAWSAVQRLSAADGFFGHGFGFSLALEGSKLLVGALQDADVIPGGGSVYAYERDAATGIWLQSQEIHPAPEVGSHFGGALALDGDVLAVGPIGGVNKTWVFDYDAQTRTWLPSQELRSPLQRDYSFGAPLALEGNRLLVCMLGSLAYPAPGSGYTTLFVRPPGGGAFRAESTMELDSYTFGAAVAMHDGLALVTGASAQFSPGEVFRIPLRCSRLGEPACTTTPNSTQRSARLLLGGSGLTDDPLHLRGSELPPGRCGIVLAGRAFDFTPLGQGYVCIGAGAVRFTRPGQVFCAALDGSFSLTLDPTDWPSGTGIQPGDSWIFQAWYRDQNPGPTSNLTDARYVRFQ